MTTSWHAIPVEAQTNRTICSLNSVGEACTVNGWSNGHGDLANLAVTWLSDGKQTFYAISRNGVQILEDNGRPTAGQWQRSNGAYVIHSSRGNNTVIPW